MSSKFPVHRKLIWADRRNLQKCLVKDRLVDFVGERGTENLINISR